MDVEIARGLLIWTLIVFGFWAGVRMMRHHPALRPSAYNVVRPALRVVGFVLMALAVVATLAVLFPETYPLDPWETGWAYRPSK
tara:strand:- start:61 stop:312 length:252 start_codon:yes stop_codon:yes gene_type:complete